MGAVPGRREGRIRRPADRGPCGHLHKKHTLRRQAPATVLVVARRQQVRMPCE